MLNLRNLLCWSAVGLFGAALLVSCAEPNGTEPAATTQNAGDWKQGLDEDVVASLEKLSDEDRSAALAQQTCPVTDKVLGSMGKPPKVTIEGRDVFLCCAGCEDELKSDSAKYLAKLNGK